jgi:hypothetical protein
MSVCDIRCMYSIVATNGWVRGWTVGEQRNGERRNPDIIVVSSLRPLISSERSDERDKLDGYDVEDDREQRDGAHHHRCKLSSPSRNQPERSDEKSAMKKVPSLA